MSRAVPGAATRRRLLSENDQAILFRALRRTSLYALVAVVVALVAFPLFWMVASSFKDKTELYAVPPTFFPTRFTFGNYLELLWETNFLLYFRNSLIVAGGSTLLSMIVASFGGYALSRFSFPGIQQFATATLLAYMLPSIMLVGPLYSLVVAIGMVNTLQVLIVANTTFTLPFALWLLRAYFATIPVHLEEAAMIDGCTRFQALLRVVIPLGWPGIISTSIFAFTNSWNEFLYALVFISTDTLRTLPPGLRTFVAMDNIYNWGMLMAGSVLITIPALIFYVVVQRNLKVDLTAGGVKE